MKKIVILFLSTLFALACAKENQAPQEQAEGHKVNLQEVTLTASQEGLDTKTYFNKSTGELTWTTSEAAMAIFDGSGLQTFSHVSTEEGGHQATFSGTADVNNPNWVAVHPAMNSSWENSKVYVTFPCFQNARNGGGMLVNMNTMAAKVTHNAGVLNDFTMKNIGGLIKLTVTESNIKSITVSTRGGEPLTGKAELSFDGSGNPVVTPLQYNYETFVTLLPPSGESELAAGDYFVSVFPGTMASGLLFDMEKTDGTAASVKASSSLTLARAADLEFKNFDTAASWYTPVESTLTLDFPNGSWPFVEDTQGGIEDAGALAWACAEGEEKVLTLASDNSIKFYIHCSNYCASKQDKGFRFGTKAGDYLLLPGFQGKSLKKVAITTIHRVDSSRPGIVTRGGNAQVSGGDFATADIAIGDTYEWTLNGTAHNMQYRYQLNKKDTPTRIVKMVLTYVAKPVIIPTITVDMQFYDPVNNKALNPLTTDDSTVAFDTWGATRDFSSSSATYTISGTTYQVTLSGGRFKIANSTDKHGLGMSSNARILLPTISGYRITHIQTGYAGQASDQTGTGSLPNRSIYLSPDTGTTNAIWSKLFKNYTFDSFPTVDEDITGAVASADYYIITPSGWFYLPYLTITYTEVSSPAPAPAPAPAQLLDGGEIEL